MLLPHQLMAAVRRDSAKNQPVKKPSMSMLFQALFDNYARRYFDKAESQIAGFRYFNVYGPQENHKGKMASMVRQMFLQWQQDHEVKLFGEYDGYGPGEQTRDFIYVKDVVKVLFISGSIRN